MREGRYLAVGVALSFAALACARTPMEGQRADTTNGGTGGGDTTVASGGATSAPIGTTSYPGGVTSSTGGTTTNAGGTTSAGGTTASGGSAGAGGSGAATTSGGTPPSCSGLAATCGPSGSGDCCATLLVPGGTFYRGYDGVDNKDMSYPATVSDFYLDKYEITVGRFRTFVNAGMGTQANPPAAGAGAHPLIPGSGWDSTWNTNLPADTPSLTASLTATTTRCGSFGSPPTWTGTAGSNESKPINCIDWYAAFAFCAWDGGRLPTEAEWNYAASGGSEQRYYPWSSPPASTTIDPSYAAYCDDADFIAGSCAVHRVGSRSPKGDGKWGQADLGGNVLEWTLDYFFGYQVPCDNCADLNNVIILGSPRRRVIRGGSCTQVASALQSAARDVGALGGPTTTDSGARCARPSL